LLGRNSDGELIRVSSHTSQVTQVEGFNINIGSRMLSNQLHQLRGVGILFRGGMSNSGDEGILGVLSKKTFDKAKG
jgi:hypothetical protein